MSEQLHTTYAADAETSDQHELTFKDLGYLQDQIFIAGQTVITHGKSEFGHTELGAIKQKGNLAHLEGLLGELDHNLEASHGVLVAGFPAHPKRLTDTEKRLVETYGIGEDQHGLQLLFIAREQMTAHRTNPQFYGTGEDLSPVVDLRLETQDSVQWVQFPIQNVKIAVLS